MIIFIILGFVSSILQLILLREFTFSIAKNELALIVAAGLWLLCASAGAALRTKKTFVADAGLALAIAAVFGLSAILAHTLKSFFGLPYYEIASPAFALVSGLLILGPTGALSGYAFSQFSQSRLADPAFKAKSLGALFAYEALGILGGGIIFTFLLSSYNNPLTFTALPLLFIPFIKTSPKEKMGAALVLMGLSLTATNNFDTILQREFAGNRIVFSQGSSYGPAILAEKDGASSLYLNGTQAATSEDAEANETFIHSAMSAKKDARKILWIGPCFASQARELEKYPWAVVTAVDIRPRIATLPSFYAGVKNIRFAREDPRLFLSRNQAVYDIILMNISSPSTLGFNRFFTTEFFGGVRRHLSQDGVLVFSLPSKGEILSPSIRNFNASILNALKDTFPFVFLIPGDSMMILASLRPISDQDILKNFEGAKIPVQFFTSYHLRDKMDEGKRLYIERTLAAARVPANRDLAPYGFLFYALMERAKFSAGQSIPVDRVRPVIFIASLMTIGALAFFLHGRRELPIRLWAGVLGFLSIAGSAIIYFVFQLICGTLFWKMGLLIGLFMAGLGLSSFVVGRMLEGAGPNFKPTPRHVGWLFVLWLVFCVEMLLWANGRGYNFFHQLAWMILSFEGGLLTGIGYPLLGALEKNLNGKTAPLIYSADLCGAFLGTITLSIIFLPFIGVNSSLLILLGLVSVLGLKELL